MDSKNTTYTYLDSCVFIDYFSERSGRIEVLDNIIDEVIREPNRKLITSSIAITEVAYVYQEKMERVLDPDVIAKMDAFWNDHSIIEIVEFSPFIGRVARQMEREKLIQYGPDVKLTPLDAIHLATHQFISHNGRKVDHFFTYDRKLIEEFGPLFGIHACEPFVFQPELPGSQVITEGLNL